MLRPSTRVHITRCDHNIRADTLHRISNVEHAQVARRRLALYRDYALCGCAKRTTAGHQRRAEHGGYYDLVAMDAATANSAGLKADGTVVSNGLEYQAFKTFCHRLHTKRGFRAARQRTVPLAHFLLRICRMFRIGKTSSHSASATHIVGVTADGRVLSRGEATWGNATHRSGYSLRPRQRGTKHRSGDDARPIEKGDSSLNRPKSNRLITSTAAAHREKTDDVSVVQRRFFALTQADTDVVLPRSTRSLPR
jgi:hypothetical protein